MFDTWAGTYVGVAILVCGVWWYFKAKPKHEDRAFAVIVVGVLVAIGFGVGTGIHNDNKCHDRGGVIVAGQCIDKGVVK